MNRIKLFSFIILIVCALRSHSQNSENNPLSRYGLGDLRNSSPSWMMGMANSGVAFSSEQLFNNLNPASSAFLNQTDVEVGIFAKSSSLEDSYNTKYSEWTGGIQQVLIAIPLQNAINDLLDRKKRKRFMGMHLGLSPYSSMGYNANIVDRSDTNNILERKLQGDGALTSFNIGFSYRINDLSIGIGLDYIFGTLNYNQNLLFVSKPGSYDSHLSDQQHISGWNPGIGLLYRRILNKAAIQKDNNLRRNILGVGLTVQIPNNYTARYSSLHLARYDESNPTAGSVTDTLLNLTEQKSEGGFPLGIRFGAMYSHQDKSGLMFAVDYKAWENQELPQYFEGQYANALGLSLGGWIRKGQHHFDPFWKKSTFRFGLYYQDDYRIIRNEQAHQYGITLGWAYPIVFLRQDALIHLNLDLGQRKAGDLLKENYVRISFGVTINDNEWFLKRKYN
ncbi:MAG: hypothetical protein IPM34_10725 [Saprospiraceae bacterium]|nr:hypothetical protein [Saprospiraceae bacterium]